MTKILTTSNHSLSESSKLLRDGGVIIFPTDTIYALACDATNEKAVERIYEIKKREYSKALAIFSTKEYIYQNVELNNVELKIIQHLMPAALTLIVNVNFNNLNIVKSCNKNDDTIGFRIPNNDFCLKLMQEFQNPIAATSVNISGQENISNIKEIDHNIMKHVDLIVDGGNLTNEASTIMEYSNTLKIYRKGMISEEEINSVINGN